ncbi:MAG: hypothetical protein ACLR5H_07750 [Oscillospiraceae bacterium]
MQADLSSASPRDWTTCLPAATAVTGPATVIRAVAAGKVAAANIDELSGLRPRDPCDVEIPGPR